MFTDFDPAAGREQALKRPALVLSPIAFNRQVGLVLAAPITSRVRGHGFEVELVGTRTHGVVLCHQVKTMDYLARGIRYVEDAPDNHRSGRACQGTGDRRLRGTVSSTDLR